MKVMHGHLVLFGLCTAMCLSASVGAAGNPESEHKPICNLDLAVTGAQFVALDKAARHLSCKSIAGEFGKMDRVHVDARCDDDGCSVKAPDESEPFDAVVVGTPYKSCIYTFKDAVAAQALEGPHNRFRFACSDGGVGAEDLPEEPITSIDGGCSADSDFDGIQKAVEQQPGVAWVFGIGADSDQNDKTGLCVQGGTDDIARCDEQCIVPTDSFEFPYDPDCDLGETWDETTGKSRLPLECRPCALTEEVPPSAGAKSYCWERAAGRAVFNEETGELVFRDSFTPAAVKATGALNYTEFEGSTCFQVTTTYRGRAYSYWTPRGCPGR